ncbi:MAG: hypothetical protein ACYDAC_05290 [Candidatus Dormibacteria bacterium]
MEIHDTVLVAAAFCMFDRYVDGLDARVPKDPRAYQEAGRRITTSGYALPRRDGEVAQITPP